MKQLHVNAWPSSIAQVFCDFCGRRIDSIRQYFFLFTSIDKNRNIKLHVSNLLDLFFFKSSCFNSEYGHTLYKQISSILYLLTLYTEFFIYSFLDGGICQISGYRHHYIKSVPFAICTCFYFQEQIFPFKHMCRRTSGKRRHTFSY